MRSLTIALITFILISIITMVIFEIYFTTGLVVSAATATAVYWFYEHHFFDKKTATCANK
ncbi:hypothetical protein FO454_05075 [Staphylococcus lugdunensis]|uniref:DUF1270 family protein n=1 Tax=Staphylococcus lugdunensis TaxID=28035 RepID=A0ABX6BTK4_STALU|nr:MULTISPECIES: hypothetical protein [Staphylococcus]OHQ42058.1 hypothetical protein HMPREF2584_03960 [Staphylococcus sp. HMSC069E09]QEX38317.1 hypothetical protein FO454_05075 [Staphylococcus lugdunensis]